MVTATARNIGNPVRGNEPDIVGTRNAVCREDFADRDIAFFAQSRIPPRNVNRSSSGKWLHLAKPGFGKHFIRKLRKGTSQPFSESLAMKVHGIDKLNETTKG